MADALGIIEVPTALSPKPAYRKRLGTARETSGAAIEAATRIAADLSDALLPVAITSRDHVNGDPPETTTRIADLRTDTAALNEKQQAAALAVEVAKEALRNVESRWREALSALPVDIVNGLESDVA